MASPISTGLLIALCSVIVASGCAPDFIACRFDEEVAVEVTTGGGVEARQALAQAVADELSRTTNRWLRSVPSTPTAGVQGFRVKAWTETFAPAGTPPASSVWVQCGYFDDRGVDATREAVLAACKAEVEKTIRQMSSGAE